MTTELDIAHRADGQAIATRGAVRSEIAMRPDQTNWTPQQVSALAQLGIENAPEGDLMVFFHRCQNTGLDPFAKQIYMIGRNTKVTEWPNGRRVERWVTKYTIQTGIDGYRVLGNRLATERADDLDHDEALWCGPDGQWVDIWLDRENPPMAAKYVIRKNGKPFTAKVLYSEYVQTSSDGETPNATWKKRPAGQLAKCAEAAAWRMAYPQDFSGVELDAAVTIEPDGSPSPTAGTSERTSAGEILGAGSTEAGAVTSGLIRSWPAEEGADDGSTPVVSAAPPGNPESNSEKRPPRRSKKADMDDIGALMDRIPDLAAEEQRLAFVRTLFNDHEISGPGNLTPDQRSYLLTELRGVIAAQEGRDTVADATDTDGTEQAAGETETAGQ